MLYWYVYRGVKFSRSSENCNKSQSYVASAMLKRRGRAFNRYRSRPIYRCSADEMNDAQSCKCFVGDLRFVSWEKCVGPRERA
jgi:hypothetical protein